MPARRPLLACALAAALALTGCGSADPAPAPTAAPPAAPSAGGAGFFGGTDLAWVEINIAMNEELVPLLDLAATRSADAGVQAYVTQVRDLNDRELTTLRTLHDEAGLPAENPHKGMPMPGMVTPDQVTEAAAKSGAAFDALLLKRIGEHFAQGTRLAQSERKSGLEPRTKALAEQILTSRADARKALGALTSA